MRSRYAPEEKKKADPNGGRTLLRRGDRIRKGTKLYMPAEKPTVTHLPWSSQHEALKGKCVTVARAKRAICYIDTGTHLLICEKRWMFRP